MAVPVVGLVLSWCWLVLGWSEMAVGSVRAFVGWGAVAVVMALVAVLLVVAVKAFAPDDHQLQIPGLEGMDQC